ncbi:MAG TPA: CpsB/CapC family capsule biosynthesis tyrosine phosphatase [Planctomycetaceae bacterium]|nr:CpsB/CapC family capsule biosynthesis tyrosine phosphatase [Planctomycetaceae bacterium]
MAAAKLRPGRIDLHSHLLPGIDDGCTSLAESLACVRRLLDAGYVGSVCTPHVTYYQFPRNTPEAIAGWVADLQAEIDAAGLEYRLWTGGEVRIAEETAAWLDAVGVPTLGDSRYVLIDWWNRTWPNFCYELCEFLMDREYRPILAHPERMGLEEAELWEVLAELQRMGVRLQGNLNSLSGGEGPQAADWARRLLAEDRYFLIASDMHRPHALDGRIAGLEELEKLVGAEKAAELLEHRPRQILEVGAAM